MTGQSGKKGEMRARVGKSPAEEINDRRQTGLSEFDSRRTRRMNRGDVHAVGEAGGGTASGGTAGSNTGDGEPDTADLADALGSGTFDARDEEDLNDLEDAAITPRSRQNRATHRAR